jgi:hypothetical protein
MLLAGHVFCLFLFGTVLTETKESILVNDIGPYFQKGAVTTLIMQIFLVLFIIVVQFWGLFCTKYYIEKQIYYQTQLAILIVVAFT